jgi:hypothetical protein
MRVDELSQQHIATWWEEGGADWGPVYTAAEQAGREVELGRFQDLVAAEAQRQPRTPQQQAETEQHILGALQGLARSMGLEAHIGALVRSGMVETAKGFIRQARQFDPAVSGDDIFQAGRNVWTMNGLQILLGIPVQVTPAVFAYSLLYPYSDNYLDDPNVPAAAKVAFNERFGRRLIGEVVEPANAAEGTIFGLVSMIEGQYGRRTHPQVHESLLAIHHAQERSVRLLRRSAPPYEVDVLGISLEKGGASVLADGYLVANTLTPGQAAFMFGLGAFLQLADDLQDVQADGRAGLLTVFSHAAGRWPLDTLADRTWRFGLRVLQGLVHFPTPEAAPLKELMVPAFRQLLTNAVAGAGRLFTHEYLEELEPHSPFRFAFLEQRRKKLGKQRVSLGRLIEAFALNPPHA